MEIFPGISMDPAVRFGKPCIAGTRVDVATVIGDLAAGESFEAVQDDYHLSREQVVAAGSRAFEEGLPLPAGGEPPGMLPPVRTSVPTTPAAG